jgi:hypothetical protein
MTATPLICLSSGLTPQYRLDILRLLALPNGGFLQFRYGEELIASGLRSPLSRNTMVGQKILLAHIDCNAPARLPDHNCPITPCRYSELVESKKVGSFYFLQLKVEEYACWGNTANSQNEVRGERPHWTADGKLHGLWCFESEVNEQTWLKERKLNGWQNVIKLLHKSQDFAHEPFFYVVEGIYPRGQEEACEAANGEFELRSEVDYVMRIFHLHPEADTVSMETAAGTIKIDFSQPQIEAITSPVLPVASPYDLKSFNFRATASPSGRFGSLVVRCNRETGEPSASQPELFIPIKVKLNWLRTIGLMVLLAVLFFAQEYIAAKGSASAGLMMGFALLAVATSIVAVLGLKKPV